MYSNYYYSPQYPATTSGINASPYRGTLDYMPPQSQVIQQNPNQFGGLKGRPVSSIDEARVAQIDFDGSLFVFPDIANKRIYTKQINLDGTASLNAYALVETTTPAPAYVTREEFDSTINNIKTLLGGAQDEQTKSNKQQQQQLVQPTIKSNDVIASF